MSETGIKSSSADTLELCFDCIIGVRWTVSAVALLLILGIPANKPAAIFILRDFSASASSSNSGC